MHLTFLPEQYRKEYLAATTVQEERTSANNEDEPNTGEDDDNDEAIPSQVALASRVCKLLTISIVFAYNMRFRLQDKVIGASCQSQSFGLD